MAERAFLALADTAAGRLLIEQAFGAKLEVEDFESLAPSRQFLKDLRMSFKGDPAEFTGVRRSISRSRAQANKRAAERRLAVFVRNREMARPIMVQQAPPQRRKISLTEAIMEPQVGLAGAVDPSDFISASREIKEFQRKTSTQGTLGGAGVIHAMWYTWNLPPEHALLIERVRCWVQGDWTTSKNMILGIRWGRPTTPVGKGAQPHPSPGVRRTAGYIGTGGGGTLPEIHNVYESCDLSFIWPGSNMNNISDPFIKEIDLKPNYTIARSYTLFYAGSSLSGGRPHVKFFGRVVRTNTALIRQGVLA